MSKYNGFRRVGRCVRVVCGVAFSLGVMVSCSKELAPEEALINIVEQPEFQVPYFAPIRVGEQVLTGDNHKNSDEYIRKHRDLLGVSLDFYSLPLPPVRYTRP